MNQLMYADKVVTMSSREISELTGKNHAHVMRDIRNMLEELGEAESNFGSGYLDANKQHRPCFLLPRREVEILLTGYSVRLRARVIDRLRELEEVASQVPAIPRSLPEALRLAADLAEQNNHLRLVVQEQAPKVSALDRIADASGSMCLTDAAKHLGVQRCQLIEWMKVNRWIYRREGCARWLAYQPRQAAGLLDHKVTVIGVDEQGEQRLASQVRVTPKGLALLAQKMGAQL
jgi:phage antirepressor YoqD-like protein